MRKTFWQRIGRFMNLTEAQIERLDLLVEEAAEIIHAALKVKRFGYGNKFGSALNTNRQNLESEIGGIIAVLELLVKAEEISEESFQDAYENKIASKWKYTKYQEVKEID